MELMQRRRELMAMQNAIPLLITFLPLLVGTGDPSPTNVRPIRAPLMLTVENTYEFAEKTSGQLNATGETISESGMLVTEFISVQPGEVYEYTMTAKTSGARSRRIVCYNVDRTFISQLNLFNWMNVDQVGTASITIPNNAEYVRISQLSTDTDISFSTVNGTAWPIYGGELDTRTGVLSETHSVFVINGSQVVRTGNENYNGSIGTDRYVNATGFQGYYSQNQNEWAEMFKRGVVGIWGHPDDHVWEWTPNGVQVHFVVENATVGITVEDDVATRTNLIKTWLTTNPQIFVLARAAAIERQLTQAQLKQAIKQLKPYY